MSTPIRVSARFVQPEDSRRPWRRLVPAGFVSLAFHGGLLALFMVLSAPGQAEIALEPAPEPTIVGTEIQTYETDKNDKFLATVRNDGSLERDRDPNYDNPVKGDVSIPGQSDPLDTPGLNSGKVNGELFDLGPQLGFTKLANGLAGGVDGKEPGLASLLELGGVLWGGKNPDYFKLVRGSAVTRKQMLEAGGGTDASEAAVTLGLRWLVKNQFPDGSWRLDGNFPDKGAQNDIAGTAFGLLPFLAAGKTHKAGKEPNPYDKPVERGLMFLVRKQDKRSGNFGGGMYGHGLATIAVCEAYGLTQDPLLRKSAQSAIGYIVSAQHEAGGWRYAPRQAGDTSVSGWQIMALKSAVLAGIDVPELALKKAQRYLDSCVSATDEGYGYVGVGSTPTMSAVGLLCRQYLQSWGPQNIRLIKGIDLHLKPNPPGQKKDIYYYYYATQVMHHFGGEAWKKWNDKMRDTLVNAQDGNPQSAQHGSWSSAGDLQGSAGGRLMITSLNLLTLEVYYRYLPLYYREKAKKG
jgi:hypothetical protein